MATFNEELDPQWVKPLRGSYFFNKKKHFNMFYDAKSTTLTPNANQGLRYVKKTFWRLILALLLFIFWRSLFITRSATWLTEIESRLETKTSIFGDKTQPLSLIQHLDTQRTSFQAIGGQKSEVCRVRQQLQGFYIKSEHIWMILPAIQTLFQQIVPFPAEPYIEFLPGVCKK